MSYIDHRPSSSWLVKAPPQFVTINQEFAFKIEAKWTSDYPSVSATSARASLYDENSQPAYCLAGSILTSGYPPEERGGGSTDQSFLMVFSFKNVMITQPGAYCLRVSMYVFGETGAQNVEEVDAGIIYVQ